MNDSVFTCYSNSRLNEKYYRAEHKSGLTVYVFPKKMGSLNAVLGVRFGSANTEYRDNGKTVRLPLGIAHFFEHKLFENEDGINSDVRFTAMGAEANAYTSYTATKYLFSVTNKKYYDDCLHELLRMVNNPYFTPENIKKEQGIIEQEIMMYADDPYDKAYENCMKGMYSNSALKDNICGSAKSISVINAEMLYKIHSIFYAPSNMILSVCGDITPDEVMKIVDAEFCDKIKTAVPSIITEAEPEEVKKSLIKKKMRVAKPIFYIGVKNSVTKDCEERTRLLFEGMIICNVLFSGTGEIYNRMLNDHLITPSFYFKYTSSEIGAMVSFAGVSDDPERVKALLTEKMKSAADGNIDKEDFIRCKRAMIASYIKSFDSTAGIADRMVLSYAINGIEPFSVIDIIENITYERILLTAKEIFDSKNNITLSLITPL